jgi:uncharacterized membrane protein
MHVDHPHFMRIERSHQPAREREMSRMEEKETGRLEAFSDGVFSVAITLLVLNIKVPGLSDPSKLLSDGEIWQKALAEWPMLAAYGTSFITIGIMWINHHRLFQHIKRTNTILMLLNLLLLLIIVFMPVPTALLAEFLEHPEIHAAALIYSSTNIVMACCFCFLWFYASYHDRLLGENVDPRSVRAISEQYIFGPFFYLISFGLAWFNVPASIILNALLALFFALPGRSLRSLSGSVLVDDSEV